MASHIFEIKSNAITQTFSILSNQVKSFSVLVRFHLVSVCLSIITRKLNDILVSFSCWSFEMFCKEIFSLLYIIYYIIFSRINTHSVRLNTFTETCMNFFAKSNERTRLHSTISISWVFFFLLSLSLLLSACVCETEWRRNQFQWDAMCWPKVILSVLWSSL